MKKIIKKIKFFNNDPYGYYLETRKEIETLEEDKQFLKELREAQKKIEG